MNATEAGRLCKVRGYIAQQSKPNIKLWKNEYGFWGAVVNAPGDDWETHDPEGEETSIVG